MYLLHCSIRSHRLTQLVKKINGNSICVIINVNHAFAMPFSCFINARADVGCYCYLSPLSFSLNSCLFKHFALAFQKLPVHSQWMKILQHFSICQHIYQCVHMRIGSIWFAVENKNWLRLFVIGIIVSQIEHRINCCHAELVCLFIDCLPWKSFARTVWCNDIGQEEPKYLIWIEFSTFSIKSLISNDKS